MADERRDRRRPGLVSRVGQSVTGAAREMTSATTEQILEDLEPMLVEESLPRILEGLTPYLSETLIPQVIEQLRPHLTESVIPEVLADLRPYLSDELVPQILESVVPQVGDDVAPQILDALLPRIEAEVAPRLVDALLPKIRAEVVPLILDDIVDDPAVRRLIREQSAGLILDALESLRENLADVDNLVEGVARRVTRQPVRPQPPSSVTLVLADSEPAAPVARTWEELARDRAAWDAQPAPPAPPGREHAYAGAITRVLGLTLDLSVVGWLVGLGLAVILGLLDQVAPGLPSWMDRALSLLAIWTVPVYLGICWCLAGRTLGSFVLGTRVCTADGRRPGFWRAQVRAWALVFALPVWLATGFLSVYDPKRRTLLDRLVRTESRYVVPDAAQRRYLQDAVRAERQAAAES